MKVIKSFWKFNVSINLQFPCRAPIVVSRMITLEIVFYSFALCAPVAPICRPGQVQMYNVGRGETAQIHCDVEGIPRDIDFVWKFNTSLSEIVLDMPSSIVKNNATKSTINFKPMTEHVCNSLNNLNRHPERRKLCCSFSVLLSSCARQER